MAVAANVIGVVMHLVARAEAGDAIAPWRAAVPDAERDRVAGAGRGRERLLEGRAPAGPVVSQSDRRAAATAATSSSEMSWWA